MKLWVAGEGPNDIGALAFDELSRESYPGVVQAFLEMLRFEGEILGGDTWKSIKKLRTGSRGEGVEALTVARLRLRAEEHGADALVFIRDRDGETGREAQIEAAVAQPGLPSAGVTVVEVLEHWLLAVAGRRNAHKLSKKQTLQALSQLGIEHKSTESYVDWLTRQSVTGISEDATSLIRWLERLSAVITSEAPES